MPPCVQQSIILSSDRVIYFNSVHFISYLAQLNSCLLGVVLLFVRVVVHIVAAGVAVGVVIDGYGE